MIVLLNKYYIFYFESDRYDNLRNSRKTIDIRINTCYNNCVIEASVTQLFNISGRKEKGAYANETQGDDQTVD